MIRSGFITAAKGGGSFAIGMMLAYGGAYNYILQGAMRRTFSQAVAHGIIKGIAANILGMIYTPWKYGLS